MRTDKQQSVLWWCCSDFTVKYVDIESKEQKLFSGHEAPVLSVALHPDEQLIVSRINWWLLIGRMSRLGMMVVSVCVFDWATLQSMSVDAHDTVVSFCIFRHCPILILIKYVHEPNQLDNAVSKTVETVKIVTAWWWWGMIESIEKVKKSVLSWRLKQRMLLAALMGSVIELSEAVNSQSFAFMYYICNRMYMSGMGTRRKSSRSRPDWDAHLPRPRRWLHQPRRDVCSSGDVIETLKYKFYWLQ